MAVVTTNLGVITAYGDAVAAGYTGTKAQWQALMANYATVGQQAAQDAQTASAASITVTPNTKYIGSLTSNSYKRGRVGVISFYFKVTTQMPVATVIATIDENVIARTDGIAFNASAFGGAVYAKNGNIVTNSVLNTSGNFYFITIPVILT